MCESVRVSVCVMRSHSFENLLISRLARLIERIEAALVKSCFQVFITHTPEVFITHTQHLESGGRKLLLSLEAAPFQDFILVTARLLLW